MALACGSSMPILCILFGDTLQVFRGTILKINLNLPELCGGGECGSGQSRNWRKRDGLDLGWAGSLPHTHKVRASKDWSVSIKSVSNRFGYSMITLAICLWTVSWIFVTCLNLAAARQVRIFCPFANTRPKLAYGRQGLDWIAGPGYSFVVFSTNKTMETNHNP